MAAQSIKSQKVKFLRSCVKAHGEELDPKKKYAKAGDIDVLEMPKALHFRSMQLVEFV